MNDSKTHDDDGILRENSTQKKSYYETNSMNETHAIR